MNRSIGTTDQTEMDNIHVEIEVTTTNRHSIIDDNNNTDGGGHSSGSSHSSNINEIIRDL